MTDLRKSSARHLGQDQNRLSVDIIVIPEGDGVNMQIEEILFNDICIIDLSREISEDQWQEVLVSKIDHNKLHHKAEVPFLSFGHRDPGGLHKDHHIRQEYDQIVEELNNLYWQKELDLEKALAYWKSVKKLFDIKRGEYSYVNQD